MSTNRPPRLVSLLISGALVASWGLLRVFAFSDFVLPLTYALPLLVCIWTRDKAALWGMAAAFAVLHAIHMFAVLPPGTLSAVAFRATVLATFVNIIATAAIVHLAIRLRERLEISLASERAASERISAQADELQAQSEALAEQNAELEQQTEEFAQQNAELERQGEELSAQTEELQQQAEELQAQTEEIQALNEELTGREQLLQALLTAARVSATEGEALERICAAGLTLFHSSEAAVVYEADRDQLAVSAAVGATAGARWPRAVPRAGRFAGLLVEHHRTMALNDAALRPDLAVLQVEGLKPLRAMLGAPLEIGGNAIGALVVYAHGPREWRDEEFRLVEWLAGQCARIMEMLRLQHALQRRAALMDLSPDGIFVRTPSGAVTFWSAGAQSLYGYSVDEAIGRSSHELLQTRWPEPLERIDDALREHGRWNGRLVHLTKDGREVVVQSRWLAQRAAGGDIVEVLESNVNITDQQRAEDALRQADRRKGEFLATLSHELRNPLAAIRYALDLVARASDADAQAVSVIDRQLAHLVRLVDDLLDITRIGSNKIQLRRAMVDLAAVVRQAAEAAAPEIAQGTHELAVVLPPAPLSIEGDSDRLAQVVTNLLNNAARYTPPGGRIAVSLSTANGDAVISVADSGIGLRREDLTRVFEMFAQVSEPGHGGLGIGLALVKSVVELHGGRVEAFSDGEGLGSRFDVHLPIRATAVEVDGTQIVQRSPAAEPVIPRRVLVVDDNTDAADMMKVLLDVHGHDVAVAYDGQSALRVATAFAPDIALLDIGLPDIDGYEVARVLRQDARTRHAFLVALTGWGQEEDRARARERGFDAHLTKPADFTEIIQLVAAAARRSGLDAELP